LGLPWFKTFQTKDSLLALILDLETA
jgi:hypothetical protein